MLTSIQRDHKWSLIYHGRTQSYHLTEYRFVDGEWLKLNHSEWDTIQSVLGHIENMNEKRMKEERP